MRGVFLLIGLAAIMVSGGVPIEAILADTSEIVVHDVESPFQSEKTQIKVLVPATFDGARRYRVIYVLPVEARNENRYGDGLGEVASHDLHNKHDVIFVAPTFSHLPWYANHPSDKRIQQEKHLVEFVVPWIERTYSVRTNCEDRLLLGFSKSGWGAWSLLLRHPDRFGRAAAWDAPLMMSQSGMYGSAEIFGTQANFEQYQISTLLRARSAELKGKKRLVLMGYDNFREHHQGAHSLLDQLEIPHDYRDGPARKHDWHSGWLSEAVGLLVRD